MLHQIEFTAGKDEVTLSFRGDEFTYGLRDGNLSAAEAERMSHDLLLLSDRLYREDNARELHHTGPEPLEPVTAEVRGEAEKAEAPKVASKPKASGKS